MRERLSASSTYTGNPVGVGLDAVITFPGKTHRKWEQRNKSSETKHEKYSTIGLSYSKHYVYNCKNSIKNDSLQVNLPGLTPYPNIHSTYFNL